MLLGFVYVRLRRRCPEFSSGCWIQVVFLSSFCYNATLQYKQNRMQHFLKNGQYFQRKKLFLQDPFHNMKSHLSLDWQAQQSSTDELKRAKMKQQKQHQNLKKMYNEQVDLRLQRRFGNLSTLDQDLSKSRESDILSRQVEMFNQSKSIPLELSKNKQDSKEIKTESQPLESKGLGEYTNISVLVNDSPPKENYHRYEHSTSLKGNQSYDDYFKANPELDLNQGLRQRLNSHDLKDDQIRAPRSSIVQDRYKSVQLKDPYPKQDLGKLMSQLYSSNKVQQYPFRNMIPDKLEGHLRDRAKVNNKKRTYQVTLNLLKN